MLKKILYAECDYCRKRVLLSECNSISTSTYSFVRNKLGWRIGRNGKFFCEDCKRRFL